MKTIKIGSGIFAVISLALIMSCSFLALSAKNHVIYPRYLDVFGKVEFQHVNLKGAMITVFCDSLKLNEYKVGANGRFDIKLDMNKIYNLRFKKEGMIAKVVTISTMLPDSSFFAYQYEYTFNINLVPDFQGADQVEAFKKPVAKIIYKKKYDGFDFDQKYNREVRLVLMSLKVLPNASKSRTLNTAQNMQQKSF